MGKIKHLLALLTLVTLLFAKSFACSFCDPEIIERQSFYGGSE